MLHLGKNCYEIEEQCLRGKMLNFKRLKSISDSFIIWTHADKKTMLMVFGSRGGGGGVGGRRGEVN